MVLKDIAYYVEESISSDIIDICQYVTTDSLLQNKEGRSLASNLPPQPCSLTHFMPGDVLVANIRPYLKKVWMANVEGGCSKDVLVIRAKDNHYSEYIYALSLQDVFFENAMLGNKGTQMPRGDKNKIMEFPVFDHEKEDEHRIGKIIENIQNKISLNTRINAELEAMAKQLYDYWFVQFDFPDENGKPYKSSGGKMVYNETLKREIPEGWIVRNISDCIKHINTGLNPRQNFQLGNGSIKYITVKNLRTDATIDFSNCDLIDEEARVKVHKRSDIQINDILFASIAPLGRCHIIMNEPQEWDINESVFSIRTHREYISPFYLYIYFISKWFVSKAEKESAGSIFAGIRINTLLEIPIIIPPKCITDLFENRISKVFKMKDDLSNEKNYLTHLRDSLLPMLMNGQVTIE